MKIDRIRALGASVHVRGDDIEVPRVLAREHANNEGLELVEDSVDVDICDGADTIGLEPAQLDGGLDAVLVALGGGAMASGVGYVINEVSPETKEIGIQPVGAPAVSLSWRAGKVIKTASIDTIADGAAGRYPIPEVLDDLLKFSTMSCWWKRSPS